jgi:hypothetical protein
MSDDLAATIHNLRRRRTRERSNVTRFSTSIDKFDDATSLDEHDHYRGRLQETLDKLLSLDDAIHDLLSDDEYQEDILVCEEYIDRAKRAIQKANTRTDNALSASTARLGVNEPTVPLATNPPVPVTRSVKLPPIRLEPFAGDVETWSRFWEQFKSSIDDDASLSTVNKHVFLRGYLEGEPKMLVDGISVTASTYEETKKILLARYGDTNRIIQAHLDFLESLTPVQSATPDELNTTFIECHRRIQALRALGEDVKGYGRVLIPKILRAFPPEICQRWIVHVKRQGLSEGDILKLLEFLGEEVEGALTAQKIRGETFDHPNYTPSAAALHVNSKQPKSGRKDRPMDPFCVFCETKGHWAQDCKKTTDVSERKEKLKSAHRCFLCLNRGHNAKVCSRKGRAVCTRCKGAHHRSICNETGTATTRPRETAPTTVGKIHVTSPDFTYLQTARIWVMGPTGLSKLTRCVLDGGSQCSFVAKSLIDSLELEIVDRRDLVVSAFEVRSSESSPRRVARFSVRSTWNNTTVPVTAFESTHVFCPHPTVPPDINTMARTRKLQLADPIEGERDLPIEVLIGGDYYWRIVQNTSTIRLSSSLVLLPTKFGWILTGNRTGITANQMTVNHVSLEHSDNEFRKFWELESIGIMPNQEQPLTRGDSQILQEFHDSFRTEDGRRVVSLPKKDICELSPNRSNAERRFRTLQKRLRQDGALRSIYEEHMLDHVVKQHVELAPITDDATGVFYMPHHAVKKERRGNIKWRIVFDASSSEDNNPSLNDVLEMGPNLLPEVLATLLRFRERPVAVIGDIQQAFLQLSLDPKDRDLTRFLWYKIAQDDKGDYYTTDEVATYRFTRLAFGLTCSPFLLSATVRELAAMRREEFPTAAPLLDSSMFMDDFVAGVEDENGAIGLYYELTALMKTLKLPMAKWATNSEELKVIWKAEGKPIPQITQALGIDWNTESDTLSVDSGDILDKTTAGPITKRQLLQTTARFYDPLGLFSPVSVVGKILFQETWCRGLQWEEILPHDLAVRWHVWTNSLPLLSGIHVPRWMGTSTGHDTQIHVFCDASEKAYGAVLYLRSTSREAILVRLACSKNRLAPVKKITLPRLELLAALVGARLLQYFCRETGMDIRNATLWTDATVVLSWIRSNPSRWKTFVCNRVTEIQTHTTPAQWRHCPGEANPADYLSRGVNAGQLKELDTWWEGPAWLPKDVEFWPRDVGPPEQSPPDERKTHSVLHIQAFVPLLDPSKYSSYWKLLRVTAWIFRFIRSVRDALPSSDELTASELTQARLYWIKAVQAECFSVELDALRKHVALPRDSKIARFNPFIEDGLIRLGGRLQCADLSEALRHPLLLDGKHHFVRLLIWNTHIRLHHLGVRIVLSELREEFWILRARQTIKKVLHKCLPCKLATHPRGRQIEAPLPADRVRPQTPFGVTGIDFAGPLYIKVGSGVRKGYIALFTCATTRAVHLELCTDLTTDKFLQAFQRFVGRRGLPHTVYTDNARTFHATNAHLTQLRSSLFATKTHQFLAQHNITWKFIAPRAAWWGGWWERMIGTTKRCLRKVLGRLQVSEEGLNTTLVAIESAINSRPIVQAEEETGALTPAHFLIGGRLTALPTGPEPETNGSLTKEFRMRQKLADDFWRRWQREYLTMLRSFHEVRQQEASTRLRTGDVALLQEDVRPRHMWKKALIERLIEGRDGKIRTVVLRMPEGRKITRPIQLVIPLEVDQGGEDVEECLSS